MVIIIFLFYSRNAAQVRYVLFTRNGNIVKRQKYIKYVRRLAFLSQPYQPESID